MGTAIRPRLSEPVIIEHDADEPRVIRPQHPQSVTTVTSGVTIDVTSVTSVTIDAEPIEINAAPTRASTPFHPKPMRTTTMKKTKNRPRSSDK